MGTPATRTFAQASTFLIFALLARQALADPPAVLTLQSARDGDQTLFVVQIQRPADMDTASVERERWRTPGVLWPRVAELAATPAWQHPIYPEYPAQPGDEALPNIVPRMDRLTFVGRCPAADQVTVTFRYPKAAGQWAETSLMLDLAHAEPIPADAAPRQRWAEAQACWLASLASYVGDHGGFFTFAAAQTRRKYDLPPLREAPGRTADLELLNDQFYATTSGALAIQESLQLDRMLQTDRQVGERTVAIKDIPAVGVKSHPFEEMRGEKEPIDSPLSKLVPADNYYVHFSSLKKALEFLEFAEQWGGSVLRIAQTVGADYGVVDRTLRQLCLSREALRQMVEDESVGEVVLTGSDPYWQDGTDIALLFQVKDADRFGEACLPLERERERTFEPLDKPAGPSIKVKLHELSVERSDSRVGLHRKWLADDICLYTNSKRALARIGANGEGGQRLADSPDFQYMRAVVFPRDDAKEDGFVFLSDAFIRRLVGPETRIKQRRRLEAATSLKLLSNAALLYGYENGPGQPAFDDLVRAGCLNPADLFDPENGTFTWDSKNGATSSVWGRMGFLTPLIEIDADKCTEKERDEYAGFRDRYQQYWRRYFDPIGVRLHIDKGVKAETCILPLIDMSAYDEFEQVAGGAPIVIDLDRFTPQTLLRFMMKFGDSPARTQAVTMLGAMTGTNVMTDWIGDWVTAWIEDTDALNKLVKRAIETEEGAGGDDVPEPEFIDIFNTPIVGGIQCRNKVSLAAFLVSLRSFVQTTAPDAVVFNNLAPYRGTTIVQIAPTAETSRELGLSAPAGDAPAASEPASTQPSERGPALYYATIGDGFYLSTQASALRGIVDRVQGPAGDAAAAPDAKPATPAGEKISANVLFRAVPAAAQKIRPLIELVLERQARQVSITNLAQVWTLGRCGRLADNDLDAAAKTYLGYRVVCPHGGSYTYAADCNEAESSVYGPLHSTKRMAALPPTSPVKTLLDKLTSLTAYLRFTYEGLMTTVQIEQR